MEQRGTPKVLQAVFVVPPQLERKKVQALCHSSCCHLDVSVKGRWKREQYQASFAIYFAKVISPGALLDPLRGFGRVPNCGRHIFTLVEWCVLSACSHLASWPWRDAQQQSYSLQQDALLEIFWSRDTTQNCVSILKQLTVSVQSSYLEYRTQKSSLISIHYLYYEYISLCSMNGLLG